jgi:hypothetical protein
MNFTVEIDIKSIVFNIIYGIKTTFFFRETILYFTFLIIKDDPELISDFKFKKKP